MVIIVPCHYEIICDEARDIKYSSFNKITHLTMGTSSLNITYGVDKSRILASQTVGGVTENRYYIGNIYEEKEKNDTITKINYISGFAEDTHVRKSPNIFGFLLT